MPARMKAPTVGTVQRVSARGWRELGRVPLFAGLSQRHLKRVATLADELWFSAGSIVIEEGEEADAFYLLLDGTAKVVRGASGRLLSRLGPGDSFGEISLVDGGARSATVIAEATLDAIRLRRTAFRELLRREPTVALRVMEALAGRVRALERDLLD